MYCPNCGSEIPDKSQFCGLCGVKVVSKENDATTEIDSERSEAVRSVSNAQDAIGGSVSGGFGGFIATKKGKGFLGGVLRCGYFDNSASDVCI